MNMNQIIKTPFGTYKEIIKIAFKIKKELNQGDHSKKIKKLIFGDDFYKYVVEKARKEFIKTSRQFKNQTITEAELSERLDSCKYIIMGLDQIYQDLTLKTHKRSQITKNQFLIVIQAGIQNWGNIKYQEKLIESFITISKYPQIDLKSKSKN